MNRHLCQQIFPYINFLKAHNIIQIHNIVQRDWQYYVKYSSHSVWVMEHFVEYYQSRWTLLWIWIMLCPSQIYIIIDVVCVLKYKSFKARKRKTLIGTQTCWHQMKVHIHNVVICDISWWTPCIKSINSSPINLHKINVIWVWVETLSSIMNTSGLIGIWEVENDYIWIIGMKIYL